MASIIETLLRYKVDKASLQQASASTGAARRIIDEYVATLKEIPAAARQALVDVADLWDSSADGAERAAANARELVNQLRAQSRVPTGGGAASSNAGRAPGAAGAADRFGSLGTQLLSGLGQSELANAVGLIGDLGGSIKDLGVAGGISSVAMIAVGVAMSQFNAELEKAKSVLATALDVNKTYYDALRDLTSAEVAAQVRDLQDQRALRFEEVASLRAALLNAYQQAEAQLGTAGAAAARLTGQFSQLEEALRTAEGAYNENEQIIGRFTTALKNNAFALNDAAAAAAAAADAERELAQERINGLDEQVRNAIEARNLIRTASSEQLEARRQQLADEQAVLRQVLEGLRINATSSSVSPQQQEAAAAALERYEQRLAQVTAQIDALNNVIAPAVASREAEADAVKRSTESIERSKEARLREAESIKARITEIANAEKKIADLRSQGAAEITRIQAGLREREIAIAQSYADAQDDIIKSARADELEAYIQTERERLKIIKQGARAELTAIGNRDALALLEARRAKEDQLDDLKENAKDERRKRQESLDKQLDAAESAYKRQIDDARRAAAEQVNASRQRVNAEIAAQRQIISTAQNALAARVNVERNAYAALNGAVFNFVAKVQQAAGAINAVSLKGASRGGSSNVTVNTSGGTAAIKALQTALRQQGGRY